MRLNQTEHLTFLKKVNLSFKGSKLKKKKACILFPTMRAEGQNMTFKVGSKCIGNITWKYPFQSKTSM